jgi:hypothetical protein
MITHRGRLSPTGAIRFRITTGNLATESIDERTRRQRYFPYRALPTGMNHRIRDQRRSLARADVKPLASMSRSRPRATLTHGYFSRCFVTRAKRRGFQTVALRGSFYIDMLHCRRQRHRVIIGPDEFVSPTRVASLYLDSTSTLR